MLGRPLHRKTASRGRGLRLDWPGRSWEPGAGAASRALGKAPGLHVDEIVGGGGAGRLVLGDALDVAHALLDEGLGGQVHVVYLDPPFASQAAYRYEARLDGPADGRVLHAHAYDDRWRRDDGGDRDGIGAYLDMLAPRLEALSRLLAPGGTIWVHVDYRASYLVRVALDEILGRDAFVNEIVWRRAPNLGRQAASLQFGRTLDTIVVYGVGRPALVPPTRLEPVDPGSVRRDEAGRPFVSAPRGDYTDASIERLEGEGRVHRTASGKVYVKYFLVPGPVGALCRERRVDTLWTDVKPLRHARPGERTGFPTQKPLSLLERIVGCASPPGGLVVDLFAGSGTTAEAAHALGRRFVVGDGAPLAVGAARARLLRAGIEATVLRCGDASVPSADAPEVLVARDGDGVRVELVAPREPLAWAIDVGGGGAPGGAPFRTAWHSERAPGMRARPAERIARLPAAPGPLVVRVWLDDGRVASVAMEGP